jgi:hypothetical protein
MALWVPACGAPVDAADPAAPSDKADTVQSWPINLAANEPPAKVSFTCRALSTVIAYKYCEFKVTVAIAPTSYQDMSDWLQAKGPNIDPYNPQLAPKARDTVSMNTTATVAPCDNDTFKTILNGDGTVHEFNLSGACLTRSGDQVDLTLTDLMGDMSPEITYNVSVDMYGSNG